MSTDTALPPESAPTALGHLRIVELGDMPAAYAARWLGDLGADVIKVEPPGGDPSRWLPPFAGDIEDLERGLTFINANHNKRSVVLDVAGSPTDRQTLLDLLAGADAFIEATPPGALESWGLSQETLLARNPALVTVSLTPFGQTGPYARYKGGHAVVEAMSGLMKVHGDDNMPPCVTPAHQVYQMASIQGAYLALGGIRHAQLTGAGQRIDLSLQEALTYTASHGIARYTQRYEIPNRPGAASLNGATNVFRCKDGRYISLAIHILPHWNVITREWMEDPVLSAPEWDQAQYRRDNADLIFALFSSFIEQFDADEFVEEAQRRGLPACQVYSPGEFMASEHMQARNWTQMLEHPIIGRYEAPGFLFRMNETPLRVRRPAPTIGQHQEEVLAEARSPRPRPTTANGAAPDQPLLKGVRVADLTRFFAGPIGTMFLGFYGAEVIKVESEDLVANREPTAPTYPDMNRSKLSCTIDTRHPEGKELLRRLLEASDILVDNFSPGVIDRLGFGWESVSKIKPGLVQITAPGMGLDGPLTKWVTWGNQLVAYTGLSYIWGYAESPMAANGKLVIPDYLTAGLVALSSLAALEHRDRTGQGQFIELAQVEGQGATLGPAILDATVNGRQWEAMGYEEVLGVPYAPYGCYPCKGDDDWIVIACETDEEWQELVHAMGGPTWATDDRFATREGRRTNRGELDAHLREWTPGFRPRQLMRLLQARGVPAGAVLDAEKLYHDVHLRARGHVVDVHEPPWGTVSHQGLPGIPSHSHASAAGPTPWIGDHNAYVFGELLGLSPEEFAEKETAGAIR